MRMDMEYIDNWSLSLDVEVLAEKYSVRAYRPGSALIHASDSNQR